MAQQNAARGGVTVGLGEVDQRGELHRTRFAPHEGTKGPRVAGSSSLMACPATDEGKWPGRCSQVHSGGLGNVRLDTLIGLRLMD